MSETSFTEPRREQQLAFDRGRTTLNLNKQKELQPLTGIRFPLALWVVAHHLSDPGHMLHPITSSLNLLEVLVDGAWLALGTFFAISGFVLTLRYRTTRWTSGCLVDYGTARLARVYPVYLLSLLIIGPIIADAVASGALGSTSDRAWLLLNYGFILQGWTRLPVDWNTPAWSLSCELFFYAWFPLLILLLRKLSLRRVIALVLIGFAVPLAIRLAGVPTTYKPLIYFGDFVIGIGAAGLYQLIRRGEAPLLQGRGYLLYLPAGAAALALLLYAQRTVPFLVFDTALRFANGVLVLGLAYGGGTAANLLSSPLCMWGGRASYAIYILHVPVLWWYKRSTLYETLPDVAAGVMYLTIVVLLSGMICQGYERPLERKLRAKLGRWRTAGFASPQPGRIAARGAHPAPNSAVPQTAPAE